MDIKKFNQLGYIQKQIVLPAVIQRHILSGNYSELDSCLGAMISEGGMIYNELVAFGKIYKTEYLIAIRDGEDDEDGIWHDDGSRELAFTLSLVNDLPEMDGGVLMFREKENHSNTYLIPTPEYGTLTVIKTGKDGFEHCVQKVTRGRRIICAGWIN